jgi:FkbM family methyltransferase
MEAAVHTFDNGIKVHTSQLIPTQVERYKNIRNVHEADEEDLFLEVIQSSPRVDCFVNIGSAIGYYPMLAKKVLPSITVHAYEPLSTFRNYFSDNILLNGFDPSDFHIHAECISSSTGETLFVESAYGSKVLKRGLASLFAFRAKSFVKWMLTKLGIRNYRNSKVTTVRTITLDELAQHVGTAIDYMQMDVQGHELEILKSGSVSLQTGTIKSLMIGTHGKTLHMECLRYLADCGYEIEVQEEATQRQPDGIILASKGVRRHLAR